VRTSLGRWRGLRAAGGWPIAQLWEEACLLSRLRGQHPSPSIERALTAPRPAPQGEKVLAKPAQPRQPPLTGPLITCLRLAAGPATRPWIDHQQLIAEPVSPPPRSCYRLWAGRPVAASNVGELVGWQLGPQICISWRRKGNRGNNSSVHVARPGGQGPPAAAASESLGDSAPRAD